MSPPAMDATPPRHRRRELERNISHEKEEPLAKKPRQLICAEEHGKHGKQLAEKQLAERKPAEKKIVSEFMAEFDVHGVPESCQERLKPLMSQWGSARWKQILGLWTFLGDGTKHRPVATPALQVWGPPGTGKTVIVADYLKKLEIRHVWLNCACFTSMGELNARLAELLRRSAAVVAPEARELQHRPVVGRQLRSVDRLEVALKLPLDYLSCLDGVGEQTLPKGIQPAKAVDSKGPVKVVVVLDQAQELLRLQPGGLELLISLPEVLQRGNQLSMVTISRLPLGSIGLTILRDPPAVAFRGYTEAEAEEALTRSLCECSEASGDKTASTPSKTAVSACSRALMKFATPQLGHDLRHLKGVGLELVRNMPTEKGLGALQQRVEQAVEKRVGLCDLSGFPLPAGCTATDPTQVATMATMHQMTKAEMRLVVATYLAAHIEKTDDMQLFSTVGRRKGRKGKGASGDNTHISARAPKPAMLTRILAIYHHFAQQPQLVGPPLFEKMAGLREAGLIRFMGNGAGVETDPKVICRVELPLVRECSRKLGIDLAEYLMSAQ